MLKKIIRYFKSKKALNLYTYGDVIWCNVKKYGDKFKFEEHHQSRPFLFVKYEKGKIWGYTLTHTIPNKNSLSYQLTSYEGAYVLLMCLFSLKTSAYEDYSEKMNEYDLSNISKIIYNMHEDTTLRLKILSTIKLDVNDIVEYHGEKYLVYAIDLKRLTLYKLEDDRKEIQIIHKNNI